MAFDWNDPQYLADLQELKNQVLRMKGDAFDYRINFAEGYFDPKTSGYKDVADAMTKITLSRAKEIEKAHRAFERKYPG